ncbi:MAG: P-loop NTPase [Oscillospiraceae bacterium]|jgi:septum site-determining protein MinD|nr:P-loop NTPase [Oscillospiraceae bacterium]
MKQERRVFMVASGKGGVGKSTVSTALALQLCKEHKTLLIDCDVYLPSLDILSGMTGEAIFSWLDVLNGICTPEQALLHHRYALLSAPNIGSEIPPDSIEKLLAFYPEYDAVIIDCAAGLGFSLELASKAADTALIVCTADEASIRSAAAAAKKIDKLGVPKSFLIINRYDPKGAVKGRLLGIDDMVDRTETPLLGIIPYIGSLLRSDGNDISLCVPLTDTAIRIAMRLYNLPIPLELQNAVR